MSHPLVNQSVALVRASSWHADSEIIVKARRTDLGQTANLLITDMCALALSHFPTPTGFRWLQPKCNIVCHSSQVLIVMLGRCLIKHQITDLSSTNICDQQSKLAMTLTEYLNAVMQPVLQNCHHNTVVKLWKPNISKDLHFVLSLRGHKWCLNFLISKGNYKNIWRLYRDCKTNNSRQTTNC